MTDKTKVLAFERRLLQLKEEEAYILKLLKDVRKQLKKYEVEELQTCSESIIQNEEGSDSDDSVEGDKERLLQMIDCVGIINKTSLDLDTNRVLDEDSNEESEECDED